MATRDPALDLEMRRRILEVVEEYPGLHVREVARQLSTSAALVEYHLPVLLQRGLLREMRDARYQRLYPVDAGPVELTAADRRALGLLRDPTRVRIILAFLDARGPVKHGDVASAVQVSKSRLSFHLKALAEAGVVEKQDDGAFRLRAPARTERLLLAYKPTPELRDTFADLWLKFYGKR